MYVKAYQFAYQISASSLNYFLEYEEGSKNPRWRRSCAHAPPSGKIFNLLKLLIISIYVPNFSFLTQLLPEIWSPLFAIGLTLAPTYENH